MNQIKKLNRSILKTTVEMVLVTIFVIASYFWWGSLGELNNYRAFAESMSRYNDQSSLSLIKLESGDFDIIMPVTDEYALANYKPMRMRLDNSFNTIRKYNLVAKIGKGFDLDYRFLNVSIDDKAFKLKDLEMLEAGDYMYLLFPENKVQDRKELNLRIWLDKNTPKEEMDNTLSLSFEIKENGMSPV